MPDAPVKTGFNPLALIAACVLPGLGHVVGGDRRRGICVGVGVLGLFFSGLFVGGIDTIDREENPYWFAGQALVGPLTFGVNYLHQNRFKVVDGGKRRAANPNEGRGPDGTPIPGGQPPNRQSIGKMNEIGTLFSTIAGMVNLIAIIDAGLPTLRRKKTEQLAGAPAQGVKA